MEVREVEYSHQEEKLLWAQSENCKEGQICLVFQDDTEVKSRLIMKYTCIDESEKRVYAQTL
jgi:hypothetical protein